MTEAAWLNTVKQTYKSTVTVTKTVFFHFPCTLPSCPVNTVMTVLTANTLHSLIL